MTALFKWFVVENGQGVVEIDHNRAVSHVRDCLNAMKRTQEGSTFLHTSVKKEPVDEGDVSGNNPWSTCIEFNGMHLYYSVVMILKMIALASMSKE